MLTGRQRGVVLGALACWLVLGCGDAPRRTTGSTESDAYDWDSFPDEPGRFGMEGSGQGGRGGGPAGRLFRGSSLAAQSAGSGGSGGSESSLLAVSLICGDGVRDPETEECDDGLGDEADLCNSRCRTSDT